MTAPTKAAGMTSARDLVVVETGSANLASVLAAFARLGATPATTRDPRDVRAARRVVLPGVGAFGDVVARMAATGLGEAMRDRVASGAPVLAICLGLQVLAQASEESPGVAGLGVIAGTVRRFPEHVKVPQLGWNRVEVAPAAAADGTAPELMAVAPVRSAVAPSPLLDDGYAFFANSFALDAAPDGWRAAWATHGMRFVAAIERGPQLACQFHPELSGAWGAALLDRWYRSC
jgi:imidazoleglycerol phosphate synthase glutamine amidotransferase subunit HisH